MLAAIAVWRLTENPWATAAAPALTLLTPWALREHGALTPELLAPPVLLGAALLAARPRATAAYAGALAAVAPFIKWPYALALIAIVLFSAAPKKAAVGAAIAIAVQALAFTAIFGFGLWDDSVIAQLSSGRRGLDVLKGVWGQAFWSLIGLVALAFAVWRKRAQLKRRAAAEGPRRARRGDARDADHEHQGRHGAEHASSRSRPRSCRSRSSAIVVASLRWVAPVALAFTLAQSLSLVLSPNTATPFIYPTSQRGAWGRDSDTEQVEAAVAKAEACPPGVVYAGPPFIALLAHRAMPDDQPDQFLPSRSTHLADVQKAIDAVQPRCG